jgi:hypothetical protein
MNHTGGFQSIAGEPKPTQPPSIPPEGVEIVTTGGCPDNNLIPAVKGDPEQSSAFLHQLVRKAHAREKVALARIKELENGLTAEPCFCHITEEAWHTCRRCQLLGTAKAKRNADQDCNECHGSGEVQKDGRIRVCLSCYPPV